MTTIPNRSTFESAYAGQAPWNIGKPQKPFIDIADRITGSVEDRRRYLEGLARVLKPGGRLFLMCFTDEEPVRRGRGGCRKLS
jgi:SAM-dependent methyltransferase